MKCKFTLLPFACLVMVLLFCNTSFSQVRPNTLQQLRALTKEKQSRTATEKKLSSQLLQADRESKGKQMVAGVHLKPANVRADANGNLLVDINANISNALISRINGLGGKIVFSSPKYHSLRAQVKLSKVQAIAGYPDVKFIKPATRAHTVGGTNPGLASIKNGRNNGFTPFGPKRISFKQRAASVKQQLEKYMMVLGSGSVNSEGDHTLGADSAKAKYGYLGQGIRIGVISDSYNSGGGAADDIASGDLPGVGNPLGNTTPITVVQEDPFNGTDEGRAMLQIVHDIAPKAQLFFATADVSEPGFASNILALRAAPNKCDIIVDDVFYYDEPVYQDGIIAQAVNEVTADGAMYFSSAGNGGSLLYNYSDVWEGDFNDAGSPKLSIDTIPGTIHNFGTAANPVIGDSLITSSFAGSYPFIALNWADPLGGSTNDYDLFLLDSSGNVVASSTNIQDGTQDPFEYIDSAFSPAAGDQLVVYKSATAAPRAFHLNTNLNGQGAGLKYATTGQTHGHSSAANAFSVAAADASQAYPGVFTTATPVENFSSDGPRHVFYNADTTAITPGNFLIGTGGGTVRNKPDITAADGVSTSMSGFNPFYGTSAAAPHAAAVAALLKSAKPSLTGAQIRTIFNNTAIDIEGPGYDFNSGIGLINAFAAMKAVNPAPLPTLAVGKITATEGTFSNHNGVLDPGELGNLVVQLTNPSLGNATAVSATITTTTPGVTITQPAATYGNIATGGNASNAGTPFGIGINSSVPCGTIINFYISATLGGGAVSPQSFAFTVGVGANHTLSISSTVGATPPTDTNYTAITGQEVGRLNRLTGPSSCGSILPNPGLHDTSLHQFDAYTFTNKLTSDLCISVSVSNPTGGNIFTEAYNSLGFKPLTPAVNFVGDPYATATLMEYSFTAPAGEKYTIVVNDAGALPASGTPYTLSVSYSACAVSAACTPVKITNTSIASGATGVKYKQIFTATGGSGNYIFSVAGGLPAGLSTSGDSLYGKPTQAGHFPLVVTAADVTGCPSGSQKDTLAIAGITPYSITVLAGTPQTTIRGYVFADTLKATVYDSSNKVLGGVNVQFIAPIGGASGSFTGNVDTAIVVSDSNGVATAPVFTSNRTVGSYVVTANVTGIATPANYQLTNACGSTVVTNSDDDGPGSLRRTLYDACPAAQITFAPGVNTITLTSGQIDITQAVSINGPGASSLTLDGNFNDRIFQVDAAASDSVNIAGVTITNGAPTSFDGGGGVLVYSGIVNILNSLIYNNQTFSTYYQEGGGVENFGGDLTIDGSSIVVNGAVYEGGGLSIEGGTTVVKNSTIANNILFGQDTTYPFGGWGGGIFTYQPLVVTNSTIYGNTAQYGGNLYNYYNGPGTGAISLKNSIVAGGLLDTMGNITGIGADIYGFNITSEGYNLIQDKTGYIMGGKNATNITGVDPALLPLDFYGGQTPTQLPKPNSPAINKGDVTLSPADFDQRGYTRVAAGLPDIGAVEANYTSVAQAGANQKAVVNTQFANALQGKVTENGNPIGGVDITFKAPVTTTAASGSFTGDSSTIVVTTDATGIATAPAFTANGNVGTYLVFDSIGTAFGNAGFALTNTKALAVNFGRITATVSNCSVEIAWNTLTGENGETFTLEHSTDGVNYTALYTTKSRGFSNASQGYNFTHLAPSVGSNYYRVKQTDANGSFIYSATVLAVNTCSNAPIIAYPNPVHNTLTVILPGATKQAISIYDSRGRIVARYAAVVGNLNIDVSKWAGGTYTLSIVKEDKTTFTLKVIKN